MKIETGICTWSLDNDVERVTKVMKKSGLKGLHLDVSALETFKPAIESNGWTVSSTMVSFPQEDYTTLESIKATGGIIPTADWPKNWELAVNAIQETADMGIPYLSTHAGFIDHDDPTNYLLFRDRVLQLANVAKARGVTLLLETGQETAEDLQLFLNELNHPSLGVNFDPANMLLYGKGDPTEAILTLSRWIKHVHIKDAVTSKVAGKWGQEVPWGHGEVDIVAFFNTLDAIGYTGAFAIEREAGDQREQDIINAAKHLEITV